MFRRRLLLVVGAVVLLGVAGFFLFLWLTNPTPGVTWDNFRRLRKGMSERNVEAFLGEPQSLLVDPRHGSTSKSWRVAFHLVLSQPLRRLNDATTAVDKIAKIRCGRVAPSSRLLEVPTDPDLSNYSNSSRVG